MGGNCGRLAGPAIAEHHDPAESRIDCRDQQREFHLVLTDDRREGEGHAHRQCVPRT
jgi:hypothetical protein